MAHQTGIQADGELKTAFLKAKSSNNVRLLQVIINDEQLTLAYEDYCQDDWESDYQNLLEPLLKPNEACYIFFRLDSSNANGYEWIFVNWVPNNAHVKQKMIYAATRASVKKEFGDGYLAEKGGILFGTVKDDCTLDGFKKYLISESAPPPLTMAEEELEEIKRNENREAALDDRQETLKGVAFPLTRQAQETLSKFRCEQADYVQFMIEMAHETVSLAKEIPRLEGSLLSSEVPEDSPRYHLFRFRHEYENNSFASLIFVYSMPGYKCTIKERMLYSSCRSGFVDSIEKSGILLEKKFEVESGAELTEEILMKELHSVQVEARKAFSKPQGPGGRGPRRLHKD